MRGDRRIATPRDMAEGGRILANGFETERFASFAHITNVSESLAGIRYAARRIASRCIIRSSRNSAGSTGIARELGDQGLLSLASH